MAQLVTKTAPLAARPSTAAPASNRPAAVSREALVALAYQKWQRRGSPVGDDQRDWFEAERELAAGSSGRQR